MNERQKLRMKARQRAVERLRQEFPDRFDEIYNEELAKEGIELKVIVRVAKKL